MPDMIVNCIHKGVPASVGDPVCFAWGGTWQTLDGQCSPAPLQTPQTNKYFSHHIILLFSLLFEPFLAGRISPNVVSAMANCHAFIVHHKSGGFASSETPSNILAFDVVNGVHVPVLLIHPILAPQRPRWFRRRSIHWGRYRKVKRKSMCYPVRDWMYKYR